MACCGLSPNARRVLPVDHAEMHDPETVQYPERSEYLPPRTWLYLLTEVSPNAPSPPLCWHWYQVPVAPSRVFIV